MKTIWKFRLKTSECVLPMPEGAKVLCVGMQEGELSLWAEVDDGKAKVYRNFEVYGTGWEITSNFGLRYIDTVFDGSLVWHVYEQT